jgi:hypothetical protein
MNKPFLLFLVLLFAVNFGVAQSDKINFHAGFSYEFVTLKVKDNVSDALYPGYAGITAGLHYQLMQSNDVFALTVNPNATFAFTYSSYYGMNLIAQVPVYLMVRAGANATRYNEQKLGVGLGVGGVFNYIRQGVLTTRGSEILDLPFVQPNVMTEATFSNNGRIYTLRVHWNMVATEEKITLSGDRIPVLMSNFGFGLVYGF